MSYANSVKHGVLGVPQEILDTCGAVSEDCVRAMAEGVRKLTGSDFSVATSGIAGPGGAVPGKPVGTVWIAAAYKNQVVADCHHFPFDRSGNIEVAAETALVKLLGLLEENGIK